jgi:hypothetical protein
MLQIVALASCLAVSAVAAELPVKKVVLYKHGVGYFERAGELGPGESAQLDFKAGEMNDVLKSLTLQSSGGDRVAALRYDASEPTAARLAKFPIRLDAQQPLVHLLDQLKGETLEMKHTAGDVSGIILGARVVPATEQQPQSEEVNLLLDSGQIVSRSIGGAMIRFPDPELQLQLQDYLRVLAGARSQEKRSVYIDSTDSGRRTIRANYMIPAPVWKSSYRLIMSANGEPMLEGWAIVDNTTGDDWTNVQLALVSGRPISFVSQLYEPKNVQRPVAELPEDQAQRPRIHAGALAAPAPPPPLPKQTLNKRMGARELRSGVVGGVLSDEMREDIARPSEIAVDTAARELGELFEYSFSKPVTVRKNESAMLPFLQQEIAARKLLIYSMGGSAHPMNAAELTNSTGKTLDGGPITVFEAGAYAGEALMETLKSDDKRLISYGVDLGTRITTKFDSERQRIREAHFRRGILTTRSSIKETRTYTIRNVDGKAKTLVIEHPARSAYKLIGREPDEKTANAYRFEVALAAGATEQFPVVEERLLTNTMAVANLTPDVLLSFVENKEISEAARSRLKEILDAKREIAGVDAQIRNTENERRLLAEDQDRLRKNIGSLNRVSGQQGQVETYASQLAERETRMAALRDRLSELNRKKTELEAALAKLIETMEF